MGVFSKDSVDRLFRGVKIVGCKLHYVQVYMYKDSIVASKSLKRMCGIKIIVLGVKPRERKEGKWKELELRRQLKAKTRAILCGSKSRYS